MSEAKDSVWMPSLTDDMDKMDPFKNPASSHYLLERLGVDLTEPLTLFNVLKKPDKGNFFILNFSPFFRF